MARPLALVAALLAVALLGLLPAAAEAAPRCDATPDSWTAGTVQLCRGTLTYGDYVHDDHGADTGAISTTRRTATLSPAAGDAEYPEAGQDATADLVRLTLRIRGRRLLVTGLTNALFERGQTTIAVAIDTDGDEDTGGGRWGRLQVRSRGWDRIGFFRRSDLARNVIRGTMPLPPGRRWRVQAVTAVTATGEVMNVAFRGDDEEATAVGVGRGPSSGVWFEDRQADVLGTGDVSTFGHTVRVSDLRRKRTRVPRLTPGLHQRVFASDHTVPPGEGVSQEGVPGRGDGGGQVPAGFEQSFQYLGRYQPYGIYVPRGRAPHGMQMVFHGTGSNHAGLINQRGMQQRFGEELNRVLVVPEVRGPDGYGSDIAERDILDVMDDVEATLDIDRDRVFTGGYSQGGYIAFRMSMLHPDRFAGSVAWVGFTGDAANGSDSPIRYSGGAVGNVIDFTRNLRHVPTSMLYAGGDYLVHVTTARAMERSFAASGSPYRWYLHPAAEHLTFAATDDWRKEAADTRDLRRVTDPARVTFRTADFLGNADMRIRHDRAYWVSEIRGRGGVFDYQDVDLTTQACGRSEDVLAPGARAGGDPLPWTSQERNRAGTQPVPRADRLVGTLRNVASLRLDAARTCLAGRAFAYELTTDGPATLALGDGRTIRLPAGGRHTGTVPAGR